MNTTQHKEDLLTSTLGISFAALGGCDSGGGRGSALGGCGSGGVCGSSLGGYGLGGL